MPVIRTVFQVPQPDDPPEEALDVRNSIMDSLRAFDAAFVVTDAKGYSVITPGHGHVVFNPGAWMLFCGSGVYPVTPVPVARLNAGDGLLGFRSPRPADIWDAVMVLKYKPQISPTFVRLVPDPDRCRPAHIQFGVFYASPPQQTAWKVMS